MEKVAGIALSGADPMEGARLFAARHGVEMAQAGGGELSFVLDVLGRVEGLDWSQVMYQYPFLDCFGGKRFADFVIVRPGGLKLALEVDGWDKRGTGRGMDRADFDDWLLRQNALAAAGFTVLRFSNRQVTSDARLCIQQIENVLKAGPGYVAPGYHPWFLVLVGAALGWFACLLFV
jgi:hypothetical protein